MSARAAAAVGLLALALAFGAPGGARAQGAADASAAVLAGFERCLARAVARFETGLSRARAAGGAPDFDLVERDSVAYCGVLAIAACDGTPAPLACQGALAARQEVRRAQVLADVPAPQAVAGRDPIWSDGLYPTLWAVARGRSAGPDCAGADPAYAAWCAARQTGLKLAEAVALWQVARLLGAAGPAVEAGWVAPPRYAPVPRPGAETVE
jgi:hypothetical protein